MSRRASRPTPAPLGAADRARAWLVTGAIGRGLAFAVDFGVALRTMLMERRAG